MTLETVGAQWAHPDRTTYGRPTCSVELVYASQGWAAVEALRPRLRALLAKGDVWLRLDYAPGQSLPPDGDYVAKYDYAAFAGQLAADPDFGRVRGLIAGNEPNLRGENSMGATGLPASWVMAVVAGSGLDPSDLATVYDQVAGRVDVLLPAVAPWSADTDGTLDWYPTPDGATGTMPWHRYCATLYWHAYNASRLPYLAVKGAFHAYSNTVLCTALGLDPAFEPTYLDALRNPDWLNCHYGVRVYDELLQQASVQAGNATPPHVMTEWNSLVGRAGDWTTDPAWPCNSYPGGLEQSVVQYVASKPNLMGFAVFVDDAGMTGCPEWAGTAMTGGAPGAAFCLTDAQRRRLLAWNADHDAVLRLGW